MQDPMHWADIQAAIYKSGETMSSIARSENVTPQMVGRVIKGQTTSHPIAYKIAAVTGITTEKMWPGKYLTPPAYQIARAGHASGSFARAAV